MQGMYIWAREKLNRLSKLSDEGKWDDKKIKIRDYEGFL
jgi:hypothetical protein